MKDILIRALRTAGKIQLSRFDSVHQISVKESISSIVTETDVLCEKEMVDMIRAVYPDHHLVGEESGVATGNCLKNLPVGLKNKISSFSNRKT